METIKRYLESMFENLPRTLEVMRAKEELYSMMEYKYTELINEGKKENEAISIVISEFGNLDELAENLELTSLFSKQHLQTEDMFHNRKLMTIFMQL